MTQVGKKVFDDLYLHVSAIDTVQDENHKALIAAAFKTIPEGKTDSVNVIKINLRSGKISLLEYEPFEEATFPTLLGSWVIEPSSESPSYRTYRTSLNPPILHRKELLVSHLHPDQQEWQRLTREAEDLGLFDNTRTIGFRKNWLELIAEKGFSLSPTGFTPLGNVQKPDASQTESSSDLVQRHLTALNRSTLSAPVQILIKLGLLSSQTTFFDYGCGRGTDMSALMEAGITVGGWDPHYAPENKIQNADVVNLGFVVNVIEDSAERVEAIQKAFTLANKVLAVSVMLYGPEQPGKPYRDGFLTSRNTFQKYFSQGELKDYLEHALGQQVFMAGPGIALIFADKDAEQQFNARRFRSTDFTERLLAAKILRVKPTRPPRTRIPRLSKTERQFQEASEVLQKLWTLTLDLGRYPEPIEVNFLDELLNKTDRYSRALRLLQTHFDKTLLEAASTKRAEELLLYLAAQQFEKRPTYRNLEARLQRDIKYFFNDYKTATTNALNLLIRTANPDEVRNACEMASVEGLGQLEKNSHSLTFHKALKERLPIILRAYVSCGLILWDNISDFDLIKIHVQSGKLSLLQYSDFDTSAIPLLIKRIKINIPKLDYDVFEYEESTFPPPPLLYKSRYMHEDMSGFAEQVEFEEALGAAEALDEFAKSPTLAQIKESLSDRRLEINGLNLCKSSSIPSLDQNCGQYLKFRDLIQCGETQSQLGIPNLPLNPETYNALYSLSTQVLDPVIDYFGAIRLTYGFCSPALGAKISSRVAPKLDQHAGHECNKQGKAICERLGAAVDFIIEDEDMIEVAHWITENLTFDRMYLYGRTKPIHISLSDTPAMLVTFMVPSATGRLMPRACLPDEIPAFAQRLSNF